MLSAMILTIALVGQLPDNPFLGKNPEARVTEFEGIAQEGKYPESLEISLGGVDEDGEANFKRVYIYASSKVKIYHEDDRETTCELKDCFGRLVVFKEDNAVVILKGGVHPRLFDRAMKRAIEHPEDNNDKFMIAMVNKGMTHSSYATREAATNIMKRRGLDALPALVAGSHHKDMEVKVRCAELINCLRTGV